jgi:sulfotransferase family protein
MDRSNPVPYPGIDMSIISRAIAAAKRSVGLYKPRRDLVIFPDDVFLVSYPKSGNTWSRFLVANLTHPEHPADFATLHKLVPDPFGSYKRVFDRMPRPRVIKSHECFDPQYPRVIYIVRDPRDVAVSQYHFHRKCRLIEDSCPMETYLPRFLAGEVCRHGSWGENVASWLATRRPGHRFLLLRYEDMVADTATELARIASFLGIAATPQLILQAVERSSADRMRNLEKAQSHLSTLTKDGRQDLPFVRAASSGGWKSALSPEAVSQIENAWGYLMHRLGYELTTTRVPESPISDLLEPALDVSQH